MPIKVQLTDDRVLNLTVDVARWKRVFERALNQDRVIEITNSDGEKLSINPNHVLFWAEEGEEADPQSDPRGVPAAR